MNALRANYQQGHGGHTKAESSDSKFNGERWTSGDGQLDIGLMNGQLAPQAILDVLTCNIIYRGI